MGHIFLPNNLKFLRNKANKSQKEIALVVNKLHTAVSSWENGLSEPSLKELFTLSEYFGVNIGDIIGVDLSRPDLIPKVEGALFDNPVLPKHKREDMKIEARGIPLIPFHSIGAFFSGDTNLMSLGTDRYWVLPYFKEANFLITVHGDSMSPLVQAGDHVICSTVNDLSAIEWGRAYLIDTDNELFLRYVEVGLDKEHLFLISENPRYKPFQILITLVKTMALVVGIIRRE